MKTPYCPGDLAGLKLSAVRDTLDKHLIGCQAPERDYYTLPVSPLKKAIGVSGDSVYDLVRESGDIGGLDVNAATWNGCPFVDMASAGVELFNGRHLPWVELYTNRPDFVAKMCAGGRGDTTLGWTRTNCERVRLFRRIQKKVAALGPCWGSRTPDPAIESDVSRNQRRQSVTGILLHRASDEADFQTVLPNAGRMIAINCACLFEHVLQMIYEMRSLFGEGWLPSLPRFSSAVESAGRGHKKRHVVVSSVPESISPEVLAGIASNELFGFGWLVGGGAISASDKKRGSGIHILEPRFLNAWPDGLPINDKNALCLCRATSFDSIFENDFACIAFRRHDYHNHLLEDFENPWDRKRWRTLPLLPANAVSSLVRLLPSVPWRFIGYEAGCSRTTPAGMIERMIELGLPSKGSGSFWILDRILASQIPEILDKRRLNLDNNISPVALSLLLEGKLAKNGLTVESSCRAQPQEMIAGELRRSIRDRLLPIRRLFKRATGKDTGNSASATLNRFLADFVGFSTQSVVFFAMFISAAPRQFYKAIRAVLDEECSGKKERKMIEGSDRFPMAKLIEWLCFLCGSVYRGHLMVSEALQRWIASHFQLVVILPLDRPSVVELPATLSNRRFRVGDWQASQIYGRLFFQDAAKGRMKINLKPLVDVVRESLRLGSRQGPPGWLAAKCSETNELVVELMRTIGCSSNFDLERLPLMMGDLSDRELVSRMDSRLIIRCLKSTPKGSKALKDMISGITLEMEKQTLLEAKEAAKLDQKIALTESRSIHLLDLFQDPEGLGAAAMEAFREKADTKAGDASSVYFALEQISEVFFPMESKSEAKPDAKSDEQNSSPSVYYDEFREDKFSAGSSHFGDTEDSPNEKSGNHLVNQMWKLILDPKIQISKTAEFFARACIEIDVHSGRLPDYMKQLGEKARSGRGKNFRAARDRLKKVEDTLRRAGHLH